MKMGVVSTALFAALAVSSARADSLLATSTWEVSDGGNGHTYMLFGSTGIVWEGAEAAAESLGGTLATITSAAENSFVYDSLSIATQPVWHVDEFNSQIGPWLGGYKDPNGAYQWVTGEAFNYVNWSPGEPNNSGGTENRVHFFGNPNRASLWNDITNTVVIQGYVVELVPAPSVMALGGLAGIAGLRRRR